MDFNFYKILLQRSYLSTELNKFIFNFHCILKYIYIFANQMRNFYKNIIISQRALKTSKPLIWGGGGGKPPLLYE